VQFNFFTVNKQCVVGVDTS